MTDRNDTSRNRDIPSGDLGAADETPGTGRSLDDGCMQFAPARPWKVGRTSGPTNPATPPSGRSRSISLTARRSPKFLVRPAVRIEAMCLPSHLDLRPVGFDEVWHRR
jgi:hypothetical protein